MDQWVEAAWSDAITIRDAKNDGARFGLNVLEQARWVFKRVSKKAVRFKVLSFLQMFGHELCAKMFVDHFAM